MRWLILVSALGAVACAETPKQEASRIAAEDRTRAKLDRELAGLVPGAPRSCLEAYNRRVMKAFGETLVYRSGSTRYVTQVPGCRGIDDQNILVTRTPTGQLCRGDIGTTVDRTSGFQTGSCGFGDFIPYSKP